MTVTMITVGYGEITPKNNQETIVCIISMLLACGVFGYSFNAIGAIIQDFFKEEEIIKEKLYILNNYLERKNVSSELKYSIR
jgi:hypothetical protein